MQNAYHSRMRQIAVQNASRQVPRIRTRAKAAAVPVINPMLIGLGVLSLFAVAVLSF